MSIMLAALPSAIQARTTHAIADAFPGAEVQSLVPLNSGLSGALLYKLTVNEYPVVLRIMEELNTLDNLQQHYTCMQLAAQHNIAPQVYYTNAELGVSITAYVEHQPVMALLQHDTNLIADCGDLLRRLHNGPDFPSILDVFGIIHDARELLARKSAILPDVIYDLLVAFETVELALQPHLTSAPCHNDLNPENLLYDGQLLWLIDWEGAGMGDPLFDLASLIHWFVLDARQEAALLTAYFQRVPTEHELAKLTLMKQISWCFYALIFFLSSLEDDGPPVIEHSAYEHVSNFVEALQAIGAGELRLQDAQGRQHLARVIAKQSLDEMGRPEWNRALRYLQAN